MTISLTLTNTSNHTEEEIEITLPTYSGDRETVVLNPGESRTFGLSQYGGREEIGVTFRQGDNPQPFYIGGKQAFPNTRPSWGLVGD